MRGGRGFRYQRTLSGARGWPSGGVSVGSRARRGRGGSSVGSSSSRMAAIRVTGLPALTVAAPPARATSSAARRTSTSGGRLANNCSTGRPNPVRAFDVMVFSSISHSGCSHP